MVDYPSSKPDALRDAEARNRALTREVGSLREDLKRETRRRERAVARAKECEQLQQEADEKVKELNYANRKLKQELENTQTTARTATEKNRKALQALREGLAGVEGAVIDRAKQTQQLIEATFVPLERLQRLLFHPHAALKGMPPLSAVAAPEAQQLLEGLSRQLSAVSNLATGASGTEQGNGISTEASFSEPAVAAPTVAVQYIAALKAKETAEDMQELKTRLQLAQNEASTSQQEASQLAQLLQHYQVELEELRSQLSSSTASLMDAAREKEVLAQQTELLRHEVQELESRYEDAASQSHARMASAMSELAEANGDRGNLIEQVRILQQHCITAEEALRQLQVEHADLQARLAQRQERIEQQAATIREMQAAASGQQADIRSALQLVSRRDGHFRPASADSLWQAQAPSRPPDNSRSTTTSGFYDNPWHPGGAATSHHSAETSGALIQIKPSSLSSVVRMQQESLHGRTQQHNTAGPGPGVDRRSSSPIREAMHNTFTFPSVPPESSQEEHQPSGSHANRLAGTSYLAGNRPLLQNGGQHQPLSQLAGPSLLTVHAANPHKRLNGLNGLSGSGQQSNLQLPPWPSALIGRQTAMHQTQHQQLPQSMHSGQLGRALQLPHQHALLQQAVQAAQQGLGQQQQQQQAVHANTPGEFIAQVGSLLSDMQPGGGATGAAATKPAVAQLKQDMQLLDNEIAELEASLNAATLRLS